MSNSGVSKLEEGLEEIWLDDKLGRRNDAENIRRFSIGHLALQDRANRPRTYVLNLDSEWGSGKTFFLNRFKEDLRIRGHIAVYVNAWENDYSQDPFLTVVDAVQSEVQHALITAGRPMSQVKDHLKPLAFSAAKVAGRAAYAGGKHYLAKMIGQEALSEFKTFFSEAGPGDELTSGEEVFSDSTQKAIDAAIDAAGSEILDNFRKYRRSQERFKKALSEISQEAIRISGIEAPIFVLVDELDRCRPSYAIELLERVKHIFSVEDIVFILGTDTEQLSHAVRGVYGEGFDGRRYLRRFIDRTYKFQDSELDGLVEFCLDRLGLSEEIFSTPPRLSAKNVLSSAFKSDATPARDVLQTIDIISTFVALWPHGDLRIDIITLAYLASAQHRGVKLHELGQTQFYSPAFAVAGVGNAAKKVSLKEMLNKIQNVSKRPDQGGGVTKFDDWLAEKTWLEGRAFAEMYGDEGVKRSVQEEYSDLLSQAFRIKSPETKRAFDGGGDK